MKERVKYWITAKPKIYGYRLPAPLFEVRLAHQTCIKVRRRDLRLVQLALDMIVIANVVVTTLDVGEEDEGRKSVYSTFNSVCVVLYGVEMAVKITVSVFREHHRCVESLLK